MAAFRPIRKARDVESAQEEADAAGMPRLAFPHFLWARIIQNWPLDRKSVSPR